MNLHFLKSTVKSHDDHWPSNENILYIIDNYYIDVGSSIAHILIFSVVYKWFNIYYFGMLNGAQHYSAVHTCGYLYCVDVECKKYLSRLITLRRYIIPYIERMWEVFLYSIDYNSQNTYHSFYVVTVLWNIKISTILKSPDVCLFL